MEEKVRKLTLSQVKEEMKTLAHVFFRRAAFAVTRSARRSFRLPREKSESKVLRNMEEKKAVPELYKLPRAH